MARPKMNPLNKKRSRGISMTDNEWAHLKKMANNEVSVYVIEKLGISNEPIK